jgi:hypothetical protein
MTELFLSWKDVSTKQVNIDFFVAIMEESSSAMCRQWSASPSTAWH